MMSPVRSFLIHTFVSAAAERRGSEGAPAGRGHSPAAQESAEEGGVRSAVRGGGGL